MDRTSARSLRLAGSSRLTRGALGENYLSGKRVNQALDKGAAVLAKLFRVRINSIHGYESRNITSRSGLLFLSDCELCLPVSSESNNERPHMRG
jgi:hypothetical protein